MVEIRSPNLRSVRPFLSNIALSFLLGLSSIAISTSIVSAQQITFEEILAAPDDLQLNLKYARQEVKSGRLQQAAAALERLLLVRPNWDSVRLFYGVVLYRLDDLSGAIRELSLLEGRNLSTKQESDRSKYLSLATKKNDPVRMSARYTLGIRADSNPGRVPDDPVFIFGIANEESDAAVTGSSQFRLEVDLEGAAGNYFFLQTNSYLNEFFSVNEADFIASRAKAGFVLHGQDFVVTPYILYGSSWLQYEQFRSQYGGGVDTGWSLSSQVSFHLNGRVAYEDYSTTSYSTVGNQRDGWRKSLEAGLKFKLTDTQSFGLKAQFARKDAKFDGFSNDELKLSARSLTLFGRGRYLSLSASFTQTDYDEPDNFLSLVTTREDERYYLRAAIGAPLETIFADSGFTLPESISGVVLQLGVSYSSQDSTIPRLRHNNLSGDILFTKRLNF